ncbi:CapA family protein [Candidatus Falkowbacteria bacterium]|nr:CapA family protein [Candidatus Falkowbacteria bacterium]
MTDQSNNQNSSPEAIKDSRFALKNKQLAIAAIFLAAFSIVGAFMANRYLFLDKKELASIENKIQQQLLPPTASNTAILAKETEGISPETEEISLIAVGDISFSRSVERMTKIHGTDYPLSKIKEYLQGADIVFGNLETPITTGREISSGEMIFRSNPGAETALKDARFNLLSLANNHTMNFGIKGLRDTFKYLEQAGIEYVGAGENDQKAYQPVYTEMKGMNPVRSNPAKRDADALTHQTSNGVKFAFLAYQNPKIVPTSYGATASRAGTAFMDAEKMAKAIKEAKQNTDFVIVSMHAGDEYASKPNSYQINFAHAAIDAGADLVIGHHPHVVQTMEEYKGKYIFYSLGNFVFDQIWSQDTKRGLTVKIFFTKDKITGISFLPVVIENYCQPRPADEKESRQILQRLNLPLPEELKRPWSNK